MTVGDFSECPSSAHPISSWGITPGRSAVFDTLAALSGMNVYLFLALAFGAISGRVEAPVSRCVLAGVVAQRGSQVVEQRVAEKRAHRRRSAAAARPSLDRTRSTTTDQPLTGGGTPRAPSLRV